MTRRWALIVGEQIANVIEQPSEPQIGGVWVELVGAFGPGDACIDGRMFRAGSQDLADYLEQKNSGGD